MNLVATYLGKITSVANRKATLEVSSQDGRKFVSECEEDKVGRLKMVGECRICGSPKFGRRAHVGDRVSCKVFKDGGWYRIIYALQPA